MLTTPQKKRYKKLIQEYNEPRGKWFKNKRRLRAQLEELLTKESPEKFLMKLR
jgi:hypothetical protein|nr:MAG TPA: Heavy-metal resistance [Caudoviricetes sp.]